MAEPAAPVDWAAIIAAGPQASAPAATANAPQPIGGYVAPVSGGIAFDRQYGVQARAEQAAAAAVGEPWSPNMEPENVYYEGDEVALFAGATYEDKYRMQRALVEAGLLTTEFRPGLWDASTQQAMNQALGYANQMGLPWEQAVARLASSTAVAPQPKPLVPNTRELSEIVKDTFMAIVKREPSKAEIAELAGDLRGQYEGALSGGDEFVPAAAGLGADLPEYDIPVSPLDEDDDVEGDVAEAFNRLVQNRYSSEIAGSEMAGDVQAQDPSGVFDGVAMAEAQAPSFQPFIPRGAA